MKNRKTHGGCLLGSAALAALLLLPYKKEKTEDGLSVHAFLYDCTCTGEGDERSYTIDLFSRQYEQLRLAKEAICKRFSE